MKYYLLLFLSAVFILPGLTHAASLSLSPSAGAFAVGSTLEVSLFLDTEGESVNALEASLIFPPDKLQLVSPTTGQSIIGIWTAQPRFNNQTGRIDLQGGIPEGINLSRGLVTTLTFRVRSVGDAILKFLDNSKVLKNDGLGTDVLRQSSSAVYRLALPPPAGPIVASETHVDQSTWYSNPTVILRWANEGLGVGGYSYVLNNDPTGIPDDVSEGSKNSVVYRNTADGISYFHIKALREGAWGGTTHFAVKIDTTPPVSFPLEFVPGNRTVRRQPIVEFYTTDYLSGLDHYELKLIPLSVPNPDPSGGQPFFIEVPSPYILSPLELGKYDVIVRAYDVAGNFRDVSEGLTITSAIFSFIGDEGLEIKNAFVIPWFWFWIIFAFIFACLIYMGYRVLHWRHDLHFHESNRKLPRHIEDKIREFNKYRKKYGGRALLLLLIIGLSLISSGSAQAQQVSVSPPYVSSISEDISNDEIFYIGGKTDVANEDVTVYLQNLQTGETFSQAVKSDKRGDWFYRHNNFLVTGNYLIWTQAKLGEEVSPPSPQIQMTVSPTAIQFGSSRLSYETIYLVLIFILLLGIIGLVTFISYHYYHGRKKHAKFLHEVKEAEEAVRRGFAVLRRDIESELALVKRAKLNKELSAEEKIKEDQLLSDLDSVQRFIGKEIFDIENLDHNNERHE
ncbi:MAG: cohesin domain-containing protein [Patescibacteria group bacterium]